MTLSNLDLDNTELDKDFQDVLMTEQQKAQFQSQINRLNNICWEKCFTDRPSTKLDGKTETCLSNCVGRFIDTSLVISKRFASLVQKEN